MPHEEPEAVTEHVEALLRPASVAVIGASKDPRKPGHVLLRNILDGGFGGRVYPINPGAGEIAGLACYPSVAAVPERVDQALVVLRREHVRQAVSDCATAGVRAVVVITAGFGEADDWGREEQAALRDLVAGQGIGAIGPNTIGLVTMGGAFRGSFVPFPEWTDGPVAIVAQTGIYAGAAALEMMSQPSQRVGVRHSVDIGNRIGVDELDLLEALAADDGVGVLGFYLESFADGRAFLRRAAEVKRTKPVVVLKPGRTDAGARASLSHTGSLASDDDLLDQLLRAHGIVRAADDEEFLGLLKGLSYAPLPAGGRVGVVTYSGALGVMATDYLVQEGLDIAALSGETLERARAILPDWQGAANPLDLWPAVELDPRKTVLEGLGSVLADPGVDQVLGALLAVPPADYSDFAEPFAEIRGAHPGKPLHLVMVGGLRHRWTAALEGLGIPVHPSVRVAARVMAGITGYVRRRADVPAAHRSERP